MRKRAMAAIVRRIRIPDDRDSPRKTRSPARTDAPRIADAVSGEGALGSSVVLIVKDHR
jgi:hypothetical protein